MKFNHLPFEIANLISENAHDADNAMEFPVSTFRRLAETGLLQIFNPGEPLDFSRNDFRSQLDLLRQIGAADLSVARIFEGHMNALFLIYQFANEDQKKRFVGLAVEGKVFGVWNTEAQNGIQFKTRDGRIGVIGSKTFCSGSTSIDYPIITGSLDDRGWQMAVIDQKNVNVKADPSFWNPLGMRASVSHRIDFSGIQLTEKDLLGSPGNYYSQPGFGGGAARFSAVQVGGAQAIFEETIRYLKDLGRTDDVFQKQRVAEMAILVKSGMQWINDAGLFFEKWFGREERTADVLNMANMMRHAVEEICKRVMELSEISVGARGLMRPGRLERIHRDLRYYLRQPAPDATFIAIGDYILTSNKSTNDFWN